MRRLTISILALTAVGLMGGGCESSASKSENKNTSIADAQIESSDATRMATLVPDSESGVLTEVFELHGVAGTIVIATSDTTTVYVHNAARSQERFSPASTFKIPNTLIALDLGVADVTTQFAWDGTERRVRSWNRNQTLSSAFEVSCLWCYQELARTIGLDRYARAFDKIEYGNEQTGDEVDLFWLNNVLRISAVEQVRFLKDVVDRSIEFRGEHLDLLKDIMLLEANDNYSLYAKTGWTGSELAVGWFVGIVEKGNEIWIFAMNMHLDKFEDAGLRKVVTIESLKALGII